MSQSLKQHYTITEARYDMSAIEKNMFYLLLSKIKDDDDPEREYVVDARQSDVLKDVRIEELRQAARNLLSRVYYINKSNGNILAVKLMTRVAYDEAKKEIRIRISQKLLPYLINLKKDYTQFQLEAALSLKSKYAKRLYEMLSHYKDQGIMKITIEELKHRLALKDLKTGKEQYKPWSMFKKHVLTIPQEELKAYTDISFTYILEKTARKYTGVTFYIEPIAPYKPSKP